MTTPIARLIKGTRTLDLQSGRYGLRTDFNPPPYLAAPLFAEGTSANRNGAIKVDETPVNRTFKFTVNITGNSNAEIRRGIADIQSFLAQAGDESEPLYFAFSPNSDTPEPLWGNFGAWLRYEVVDGTVAVDDYLVGARISTDIDAQVTLTVKPHALGKRQRLASAMGRIAEDVYGASDGISRGLHVPPSLTNKMTNPVFGSSTYSTGWTADASLTASQNTDERFVLPGAINSARLISRSTGQEWYQSINAGNTNTHSFIAYIMLPDLGTPSSSDCELYYNATLTTTFTNLGNGLWRLTATAAGINAATNTGIQVKNGREIYLLYYGMIEGSHGLNFMPIWGDNLGCAWSGTAHASTSTSTTGRVRVAVASDTFDYQQGAVRIVWTPPLAYSDYPSANYQLFDAGSMFLYFDATNDYFAFYDGTNLVTVNTTFAANTPIVIHGVWGPSGLLLYINGTGASGTYTMPAAGSYFYIASSETPGAHTGGVYGDFAVFGRALTATEVANDYANVAQLTADNQRVGCIPWLWTKDGDDVVDNCDDSTRDNWAVCGGVPGSAEAITRWQMTESNTADLILSNLFTSYGNFARPAALDGNGIYYDAGGTAGAGTDSNSDYKLTSVTTTYAVLLGSGGIFTSGNSFQRVMREFFNREFFVVCRLYDEGSNFTGLRLTTQYGSSSATTQYPTWPITTTNANRLYLSQYGIVFPKIDNRDILSFDFILTLSGVRSTGTANIRLDWAMAIPKPFFVATNPGITNILTIEGEFGVWSSSGINNPTSVIGEAVNLMPEKANMIISIMGSSSVDPVIAWTNTFTRVDITPRYQLL